MKSTPTAHEAKLRDALIEALGWTLDNVGFPQRHGPGSITLPTKKWTEQHAQARAALKAAEAYRATLARCPC